MKAVKESIDKQSKLNALSNSKAMFKDIQTAAAEIMEHKKQRQSINSKIKAIREDMEAKGIDKVAFDDGMKYFEANKKAREGYDVSRQMVQEALAAAQEDLFGHTTRLAADGLANEDEAEAAE